MVKVNYDGALFFELDEAGVGFVIWNHLGLVLASMVDKVPSILGWSYWESLAAVHPLRLASDFGFPLLYLREIRKLWTMLLEVKKNLSPRLATWLLKPRLLQGPFVQLLSHTRNQTNSIAHNFTRHASYVSSFMMLTKSVPPHLNLVILVELGEVFLIISILLSS